MVLGAVSGTLVDRVEPPWLLARTVVAKAMLSELLGGLPLAGALTVSAILVIVAFSGTSMTLQVTGMQAVLRDLVGPERHMAAVGLATLGEHARSA